MKRKNNAVKSLVSVIIVNWNGKKYLKDCLNSILSNDYINFEVIVVDNNSTDGSREYIKKYFKKVKLVELDDNYGFTGGNIEGVRNSNGEYLLFLNNDTKSDIDLISKLVSFYKTTKDCGVVQPKIRILKHPEYLDGTGSYLTVTGFLQHEGHKELERKSNITEPKEVFVVKGACMLVSRKLYTRAGGFDERFFAYFEETDLCWRIVLLGKKNYYYPKTTIYHAVGRTTSRLKLPFIEYHSFKNRITTLIKNLEAVNLVIIIFIHMVICIGVSLFYLITGKWRNALAIMKAIGWNLFNFRKNRRHRNYIQVKRSVSDGEIFDSFLKKIKISSIIHTFTYYFLKRGKVT